MVALAVGGRGGSGGCRRALTTRENVRTLTESDTAVRKASRGRAITAGLGCSRVRASEGERLGIAAKPDLAAAFLY